MDTNILHYPKELYSLLNVFKPCFSKPQFNNFCQIAGGLSISSKFAIARFSKMFQERDESSLDKFFSQSPWDEDKVKTQLHRLLFKSIPDLSIFIGDDTLSEKPFAKAMEGVDSHYSNLKKQHCNGHSIVTTGFYEKNGCIPFDVEMYLRKEKAKELEREFKTKNRIMCEKLDLAAKRCDFDYFLIDSWYSNVQVLGKVKQLKKKFITQIKSNRNVTTNHSKREIRNHCKDIPIGEYAYKTIDGNLFRYYETDGFISKIGTVRIIYCQMLIKEKGDQVTWSDVNYVTTNDITSTTEFIISTYLKRNSIEPFHREAKQQLGMDKYQIKSFRGIERYLFLVLLVYVLLMMLNKLLIMKGMERQTICELKVYLREDCYTSLLRNAKIQKIDIKRRIAKNIAYAL